MKYKRTTLVLLICLAGSTLAISQEVSESRILQNSFHVTSEMKLDITNKYGKVHVSPTEQDSVSVRIEISASASSQSRLRKIIDGVSVDLNSTKYYVIARTRINSGPGGLFEIIRSITNNLISVESKLEINYWVTAPPYIEINIDNRYGDIFIEGMDNDINVKLSNGSLKAENLFGKSTFNLIFSDANFNTIGESMINASYGDLTIGTAGMIDFTTVSSRIDIGAIKDMNCNSKRDKYFIKEISELRGEGYFSDFEIGIIDNGIDLISHYGSIRVGWLGETVDVARIESSYTNVYLDVAPGGAFNFDIRLVRCPVTIPDHWSLEESTFNKDGDEYFYSGIIGNSTRISRIILDLTRGSLGLGEN